jgi:SSS family solute:Na+ symporter/sodium/pantothenate symporter
VAANLRPVGYLQAIVVFCGSSAASTFVIPAIMTCFWRRANAAGAICAMIAGSMTCLTLLMVGSQSPDPLLGPATSFRSYYLWNLEPIVWGLLASAVAGVGVSLMTAPPDAKLVAKMFDG